LCVLLVAALAVGCGGDTENVTAPSSTSPTSTQVFAGMLPVRGSSFYSFQVLQPDIVSLTLASVAFDTASAATTLGLGIGTPNGTDCELTRSISTAPGLASHLVTPMTTGTFCVKVFDVGILTVPANFAVRIVQSLTPTASSTSTRTTDTFSSTVARRGSSTHVFAVPAPGTVNVTLNTVGPPALPLRLGLGITGGTSTCALSTSVVSDGGTAPQISQLVDAGIYCVQVADVGSVTAPSISFSLTVDHP
jgi:hypothetical protein